MTTTQLTYNGTQITLSVEQSDAYTSIFEWIDGYSKFSVIQGSPGTGKTFLMTLALKQALEERPNLSICVGTPAHKAKSVIKNYLIEQGIEIDCYTCHSLLGLGQDIDEVEGKKTFKTRKDELPIHNYDLVWIDEFSMLNTDLFNRLLSNAYSLLFTGDTRQLMPIKESSFPVWEYATKSGCKINVLTQPQRYSGSIKDAVYELIPCIDNKRLVSYWDIATTDEQMLFTNDIVSSYLNTDWESGDSVCLAYKNQSIDRLNTAIRYEIYGKHCELQQGERVLTYAPINGMGGQQNVANNGTYLTVSNSEPTQLALSDANFNAKRYQFEELSESVLRIDDDEWENWQSYLTGLRLKAKKGEMSWGKYYRIESLNAAFKPAYALTIHKSQGSGYKDVLLLDDFASWLKDGEAQPRLYYVAISRAKERFHYATRI